MNESQTPATGLPPGTVMPDLAQTEPGYAAYILHLEMTKELDEFPGTPYCDEHPTK